MSRHRYDHEIYTAAKLGNIEPFYIASINSRNSYGLTALMISVADNNVLALKRLLSAGANINLSKNNTSCITALTMAVGKNRVECVKELIRAGAFFNCDRGLEALKMARDHNFLDAVVEGDDAMKKYIKHNSDQRGTAVYVAFKKNCFNLLIALVDSGVSLNLRSLTYEDMTENKKMTTLLLKSAKITLNEKVGDGQTLLKQAIHLKDIQFLKFLIENHVDLNVADSTESTYHDGQVALVNVLLAGAKMEAVSCSYIEVMKSLITSIADVNLVDENGSCLLIKAVQSKQIDIVKFLLEKKINIDQADDSQSTALHYACRSNNLEIVKQLLSAGAKVEVYNNESLTPFSEACKISNIDMMKLLINAGSDINCVDNYQRTPLINSIRERDNSEFLMYSNIERNFATTQFLLEHGSDISKVDIDGMTALMWAAKINNEKFLDILLDFKPKVNCVDLKQTTALAYAVMSLNVKMVTKLIQAGADVNIASNCQVKCNKKFDVFNTVKYLNEMHEKVIKPSNGENTPLHIAISGCRGKSSNKIIDLLLKSGANVNAVDENGRAPLHLAAIIGDQAMAEAFVRRGAKINVVDNFGIFPLHISILYKCHELTQCLIEDFRGLFVLNLDALSSSLYLAVLYDDTSLVESLFNYGARVKKGSGAELLISLEHANYDVTLDLLEHGADANVKDSDGIPALLKAIRIASPDSSVTRANVFGLNRPASLSGNGLMLKHNYAKWYKYSCDLFNSFLDNGANVSATDNKGNTCLHAAAKFCGNSNLQLFVTNTAEVNVKNVKGETPLMKACRRGNVEAVRYLLSVGADVMLVDENRDTALHHAVISARRENHVNMVVSATNAYVKSKTSDIAKMLVGSGINIHARNRQGNTALYLAVNYDCLLTILLINLGANVNEQNKDGDTPLFFLKNHKVISYLLDAKADINIRNNRGETALHRVYDVEIARALLDRGAEMIISTEGQTALMYATTSDNFGLVQLLVERGANINVQDNEGRNCLMQALVISGGYRQFNLDILKFLIQSGTDVNASDIKGQTACMLAVINDCFEILSTLQLFGADLNKVDKENRSVLVHVLLNNRIDRMTYIMEVLKLGADIVVDSQYRYLVQSVTKEFETKSQYATIKSVRSPRIFQFFVLNGCILNPTKESTKRYETSMFYYPIYKISLENLDFIKYIFAIGMIFKSDLQLKSPVLKVLKSHFCENQTKH